jgi:hypothetical protein
MLIHWLLREGGIVGHHPASQRRRGQGQAGRLLSHVVDGMVWYQWMHCRHQLRDVDRWRGRLPSHWGGWPLDLWCACNGWSTAGGQRQDSLVHVCHQTAHCVGVGGLPVVKRTGLCARRTCVCVINVAPVSVAVMPILELFVGRWPRLHIPAGILRIPVFSVPVAFFSQESQFLFRYNFFRRSSGNLSV